MRFSLAKTLITTVPRLPETTVSCADCSSQSLGFLSDFKTINTGHYEHTSEFPFSLYFHATAASADVKF